MIQSIRLQNFRSYRDASFEFEPSVNIVVGPNASGKTNLLEAIMVLAQGSSYKSSDANLIRHKASWARLDGFFNSHNRVLKLQTDPTKPPKLFEIDTKQYRRLSMNNQLPLVYFEPEHLQAITRGPLQRRELIDELVIRAQPALKQVQNAYQRALAQRNSLLKKGSATASKQIFVWNIRLAELGSQVAKSRADQVEHLNKNMSKAYSQIASRKTRVKVEYGNQFPIESYASRMVSNLEKTFEQDILRGFTSNGPHREDFKFFINNQFISDSASRGEVRSLLLAIKKLELGLVKKAEDEKPILLLDDVFSELDGSRRAALVDIIGDHQTILTTTDADAVVEYFSGAAQNIIALK